MNSNTDRNLTESLKNLCIYTDTGHGFQARLPLIAASLVLAQPGCIAVVGYAPSILVSICQAVKNRQLKPALVIGMPVGFSHAPAAKRLLIDSGVPFITISGTFGGGLLPLFLTKKAIALRALACQSL